MAESMVQPIYLAQSFPVIGKAFRDDYAKFSRYISEVTNELISPRRGALSNTTVAAIPNKALGTYCDNPPQKEAEELLSSKELLFIARPK